MVEKEQVKAQVVNKLLKLVSRDLVTSMSKNPKKVDDGSIQRQYSEFRPATVQDSLAALEQPPLHCLHTHSVLYLFPLPTQSPQQPVPV